MEYTKKGSKNNITLEANTLLIFVPTWNPFRGHANPKGTARLKKANSFAICGHLHVEFLVFNDFPKNSKHPRPNTQPTNVKKKNPPPSPTLGNSQNLWSPRTGEKTKSNRSLKRNKKKEQKQKPKKKKNREASDLSRVRSGRNYNPSATLQPDLRQPGNPPSTVATPGKPANQPTNQPRFHQPRFLEFIFGFKLHFSAGEN